MKEHEQPLEPIALSIEAAARSLGVGRVTIFKLLRDGHLRRIKIGRRTVIPMIDLTNLIYRLDSQALDLKADT